MQATALVFDVLMTPGGHAVQMRQVYNKTRSYLEWMAARIGASVTVVDDNDREQLAAAIRPDTRFVFAETFTNPLVRAQDFVNRFQQFVWVEGLEHCGSKLERLIQFQLFRAQYS